jgi:hypothetical protein
VPAGGGGGRAQVRPGTGQLACRRTSPRPGASGVQHQRAPPKVPSCRQRLTGIGLTPDGTTWTPNTILTDLFSLVALTPDGDSAGARHFPGVRSPFVKAERSAYPSSPFAQRKCVPVPTPPTINGPPSAAPVDHPRSPDEISLNTSGIMLGSRKDSIVRRNETNLPKNSLTPFTDPSPRQCFASLARVPGVPTPSPHHFDPQPGSL